MIKYQEMQSYSFDGLPHNGIINPRKDGMREKTYHLYVDSREKTLLLHSLVELKKQLIQQGKNGDCVDEIIFKIANAPIKKVKIEYV